MTVNPVAIALRMARLNPAWSRPDGASSQCEQASTRLTMALEEEGITSTLIRWPSPPHVAVLVEDTVIDLTARQFEDDIDYPFLTSPRLWRSFMTGVATAELTSEEATGG